MALGAAKAPGWSQMETFKKPESMMVYDEERSFTWLIDPGQEGYDELSRKVIFDGFGHVKGFFNAKFVNGNLSINVEDIRRPRPW